MRTWIIVWMFIFVMGSATGCVSFNQEKPDIKKYAILVEHNTKEAKKTNLVSLKVRRFDIATMYEGSSFVYRKGEYEFEHDYYNQFILPPAIMFTEQARAWLQESTSVRFVAGKQNIMAVDYEVQATITQLYVDMRNKIAPRVKLAIEFTLFDTASVPAAIVFKKEYDQSIPIDKLTIQAFVDGWKKAFINVLTDFEKDLMRYSEKR